MSAIKHVSLDSAAESVKQFVRSLGNGAEDVVLELEGRPLLDVRVIPTINRDCLREAILARRDESRALNADWEASDRDVWSPEARH